MARLKPSWRPLSPVCKRAARLVLLGACLLSGCAGFDPSGVELVADATIPPPPFTPSNFEWEAVTLEADVVLGCGTSQFDSTTLQFTGWCGQAEPKPIRVGDAIVLAMASLTIAANAQLRLTGDHPVILAVAGKAIIDGSVDASAVGITSGPGGAAPCSTTTGTNGLSAAFSDDGGSGGGGGGFGSTGSDGGQAGLSGRRGGYGGAKEGQETLVPLRGGCSGGTGGSSSMGSGGGMGGAGGGGGGGLQISADKVAVKGEIAAAGGGGQGGSQQDGGGGGGGGGGILLEAIELTLEDSAAITANGGGGGEGGSPFNNDPENSGSDGSHDGTTPAMGGNGNSGLGGDGGSGAALGGAQRGQDGDVTTGGVGSGGGGGGGGAGRIRLDGHGACNIAGAAIVSPAATSNGGKDCP